MNTNFFRPPPICLQFSLLSYSVHSLYHTRAKFDYTNDKGILEKVSIWFETKRFAARSKMDSVASDRMSIR
jgi:hypothetical protein